MILKIIQGMLWGVSLIYIIFGNFLAGMGVCCMFMLIRYLDLGVEFEKLKREVKRKKNGDKEKISNEGKDDSRDIS